MSFSNGPYIFSDVPGYEISKGERIVKAFQKLCAKINHLEQAKFLEKNSHSQEVQTSSDTDLTINDIKYEILLTQLRYLIKTVREYGNGKSSDSGDKGCNEMTTDSNLACSSNSFRPMPNTQDFRPMSDSPTTQHENQNNLPCRSVSKIPTEASQHNQRERSIIDHQVSTTGTQTSNKVNASDTTEKLVQDHSKQNSHYHLKLDDVPFILGASATASHSVVANVQNIIALMKNHNKALCASKHQTQKDANSAKLCKTDSQDANKMIRELSEDLTKLTLKHEKLMEMIDNASPHSSETKIQTSQHFDKEGEKKSEIPNNAGDAGRVSACAFQKNSKQPSKKKLGANFGNQEKHLIPTVRMQTNKNPQLARRKMFHLLKDLKKHLSEEDLSWK